ncbi:MAG: DMT family transporter [Chloroflexi bacterium]|nr:DMT family transporter [Chloroflexota bacterium]
MTRQGEWERGREGAREKKLPNHLITQSPNHLITPSPPLPRSLAPLLPYLALAFGILAVSMAAILVRWADAPATVMGFWRMFLAALVMAIPVALLTHRASGFRFQVQGSRGEVHASSFDLAQDKLFTPHASRNTHHATRNTLLLAILAGAFFALNLTAWNIGAQNTTAANVTLLGNLSVVWVPLVTLFVFKRKLRGAFWLGLACALSGVVVILGQDLVAHPALGIGDLWGIASSGVYAGYLLTMERVRARLSTLAAWWLSTATSAVILLLISIALGLPLVGYAPASYAIFATMALANQIGGFLSLNYALGHLPAPIVSTSLLAQPVLTALLAIPLLGQPIGLVQLFGGVLVLGGIFIVHRSRLTEDR